MNVFYLVDGSSYVFRAFYAISALSTREGFPTNAIYGFTRMLVKLVREAEARHLDDGVRIAVAFDIGKPTFRHALFADYKANRAACPPELVQQMPYFSQIVDALGIKSASREGYEADDIIATLVKRFASSDCKVIIVSGDKDLTQLIGEHVEMWDPMRDVWMDSQKVREKYGVAPGQMADYLALTGDSSDNIPGAKGIGPKSAEVLVNYFGSLDQMLENPEKIEEIENLRSKAKIKKCLECDAHQLRLSYQLVTLEEAVAPFNEMANIDEFKVQGVRQEVAEPLFKKLELEKLLESIAANGDVSGARNLESIYGGKDFKVIASDSLDSFADSLSASQSFAFDTETTSLDVRTCKLVGMSFSWQKDKAYYLPLISEPDGSKALDSERVKQVLGPIFSNPKIKKTGLNLKFDLSVVTQQGYFVDGIEFDCMLASYVLNPDKRQHGLSSLARIHLNEEMLPYKELVGSREHIGQVPLEDVANYAAHDAEASWQIRQVLDKLLGSRSFCSDSGEEGPSLRRVFEDIEMPLVAVLSSMELAGVRVDVGFLGELKKMFDDELAELRQAICSLAGEEFNVNSNQQLGSILFEKLGIPTAGVKKTKSGFSTDASVLNTLVGHHPIIEKIIEYRELFKLSTTYVDSLIQLSAPHTSRIYASFNQAIVATGRLSSSDPNLQNIPIRNERGRLIRKAFVAEPGCVLISADYSQIELRVLAHLCGDEDLRKAFYEGHDIHAQTAEEIFGTEGIGEAQKSQNRRIAKTINFGILYGMGAFRLANQLGVSRRDAQSYIDRYFERFPKVREYFDTLTAQLSRLGYVETLFGRRRYQQQVDASGRDSGYVMRSLLNTPIQGTAAEIMKLAMIKLHNALKQYGKKARIIMQVHDELIVEAHKSIAEEVRTVVEDCMESAVVLNVPLKVESNIGESWGEI
ncbi:MAG: DNA polymerase I [Deltaproteobacteria bacterium]|nr:DNA polymerase I [Deltaproteobacteria bacterium]